MPIYEYHCPDCDTRFEKLISLSRANEQPACPKCTGGNTRKLLSTFASIRGSSNGSSAADFAPSQSSSGGGCAGCSGGHCSTCH